jgi:hypothetical protein
MATPLRQPPPPPPDVPPGPMRDWLGRLNRWFLDLSQIISPSGGIDPGNIPGYDVLAAEVATNTANIATNTTDIALNTSHIASNTAAIAVNTSHITTNTVNIANNAAATAVNTTNITTNTAGIAANTSAITALQARAQVLNGAGVPGAGLGNNGDLYLNNTGGAGTRLYGKITGAWVAIA